MARCPGCDRELAGVEKLCADCFAKEYAAVAPGKKGFGGGYFWTPLIALLILAGLFLLDKYLQGLITQADKAFQMTLLLVKLVVSGFAVTFGIRESLRWHSVRGLLFWTLGAINLGSIVIFWISDDLRRLALPLAIFLIDTGRGLYWKLRDY